MSKSRTSKDIYAFDVFEAIKSGETVYAINKAYPADGVMVINEMPVEHAVYLMNRDAAMFWIVVEEETDNG